MKKALERMWQMKRKFALTVFCTLFGSVVAITTGASLSDWTFFAATMITTFGIADVADKRLNGGKYDETQPEPPREKP